MNKLQWIMHSIDEAFAYGTINQTLAAIIVFLVVAIVGFFFLAGLIRNRPEAKDGEP